LGVIKVIIRITTVICIKIKCDSTQIAQIRRISRFLFATHHLFLVTTTYKKSVKSRPIFVE